MSLATSGGQVDRLVRAVWAARETRQLSRDEVLLAQQLAVACAADVVDFPELRYDPECDRRVLWLREVIREVRTEERVDAVLEACVGWLLFGGDLRAAVRSGKDLAAGGWS